MENCWIFYKIVSLPPSRVAFAMSFDDDLKLKNKEINLIIYALHNFYNLISFERSHSPLKPLPIRLPIN